MTLPTHLLWLDLETTGLDPAKDSILECAATLVPFNDPFSPSWCADSWVRMVLRHRDWSGASDAAVAMHAGNGLMAECALSSHTLSDLDLRLHNLIHSGRPPGLIVLAGSSVHFDKGFLRQHLPAVEALLHHRTYDVSSTRNFAYSLGMPEMSPLDPAPHRAFDDVVASIKLGMHLRDWFRDRFKQPNFWGPMPSYDPMAESEEPAAP